MAPEELKSWISAQGISQGEFAMLLNRASRRVHVDQSEVSRWLRGRRLPNAIEIAVIEKVTGVRRSAWPSRVSNWAE